jgi:hypothetical protein
MDTSRNTPVARLQQKAKKLHHFRGLQPRWLGKQEMISFKSAKNAGNQRLDSDFFIKFQRWANCGHIQQDCFGVVVST